MKKGPSSSRRLMLCFPPVSAFSNGFLMILSGDLQTIFSLQWQVILAPNRVTSRRHFWWFLFVFPTLRSVFCFFFFCFCHRLFAFACEITLTNDSNLSRIHFGSSNWTNTPGLTKPYIQCFFRFMISFRFKVMHFASLAVKRIPFCIRHEHLFASLLFLSSFPLSFSVLPSFLGVRIKVEWKFLGTFFISPKTMQTHCYR